MKLTIHEKIQFKAEFSRRLGGYVGPGLNELRTRSQAAKMAGRICGPRFNCQDFIYG